MTKSNIKYYKTDSVSKSARPILNILKLGIVARNYNELNGNSDFSKSMFEILDYIEQQNCDSVLFSLYTLLDTNSLTTELLKSKKFKNLRTLFIEEFKFQNGKRINAEFKVYYKHIDDWHIFKFNQKFDKLKYTKSFKNEIISPFFEEVENERILGNLLILLCGESNIVKYSKLKKDVVDNFNFLNKIPKHTNIILNPVHDKMTRFEMKRKRQFLSKDNRIVVSVWNKGKIFKNGQSRDGSNPPWTIFFNGEEKKIPSENIKFKNTNSKIEIGILEVQKIMLNY